ncbi:MAG: exonuclease SbcCD subunit D [Bacteroidia bacterium]|nr:exonuclease SbcCD subunit D [Bacteroidia bacterium]
MKFFHLSDLHLGKSVHEFSMLEDQEHILKIILNITDEEKPQAILISGDVFDRTVAPTEALRLFDDFLDGLVRRDIEVFIISGNHDSADRLAFGSRLMERSGVHISPVYNGIIKPFAFSDEFGELDVYPMPFIKPALVKRFYPEHEIASWTDAVRTVVEHMEIDISKRNILLAHQFVTGAATCDSEEINVGGADNVDVEVFAPFDYVALGHLHGPQSIGKPTIRYCGSPLKYSFSESAHRKAISVIEFENKDNISIKEIPLVPKRDIREIRGKYLEVTSRDFYKDQNTDDYIRITLTDEDDQIDAMGKLRVIYPNLMRLDCFR